MNAPTFRNTPDVAIAVDAERRRCLSIVSMLASPDATVLALIESGASVSEAALRMTKTMGGASHAAAVKAAGLEQIAAARRPQTPLPDPESVFARRAREAELERERQLEAQKDA